MNRWLASSSFLKTCIAVSLLAAFLPGCNRKKEVESDVKYEKIVLPVKAAVAKRGNISQTLNFSGNIDAVKRASIAPLSPGRIKKIYVNEGDYVKEGQLLAKMDDYGLQQALANLQQLQEDYQRLKTLYERGSATAQQYGQIKAAYDAAKAGYENLKNSVELRAPYAGTIIGRHFNEGEIYNGSPGMDGVAAIVALAQLGMMKIEVMVPEQEFVLLRTGLSVEIRTDAIPDTVFEGKITTVNPALNRMSRSARVTIEIRNPGYRLKPGMFARVKVATSSKKDVVVIPAPAVVSRDGEQIVFTVENKAVPFTTKPQIVKVQTGIVNDEMAEIVSGLQEGTVVLKDNNVSLLENTDIQVTSIENSGKE